MRPFLLALVAVPALVATGWWLVPWFVAQVPALLGLVGVLLLLIAWCLPNKPTCTGMHCSGCAHH